jgi:ATP-dependent Clp protease adaptor protein ClpS
MTDMAEQSRPASGEAVAVPRERTRRKLAKAPLYKVLLHNDEFTTMEFVVNILKTVFHHDPDRAAEIMFHVHERGVGVAGTYPMEIADTKARKVTELARAAEFPLLCTVEAE